MDLFTGQHGYVNYMGIVHFKKVQMRAKIKCRFTNVGISCLIASKTNNRQTKQTLDGFILFAKNYNFQFRLQDIYYDLWYICTKENKYEVELN